MAKQRVVNTKFWDDTFISDLEPVEKLMFLYVLTNPLTDLCGAYEITIKRIVSDTGIKANRVTEILKRFEMAGKVVYRDGWMIVRNFAKHQVSNPKVSLGVQRSLNCCPDWVKHTLSIGYDSLSIDHHTLTLTSRENLNLKGEPEPTDMSAVADVAVVRPKELKPADVIFAFWAETTGHRSAQFTNERRTKVNARLKTYSTDQVKQAILGCKASPYHQGQNDRNTVYDDLELICRNDTQLEKFIGYLKTTPTKTVLQQPMDEIAFQKLLATQEAQ